MGQPHGEPPQLTRVSVVQLLQRGLTLSADHQAPFHPQARCRLQAYRRSQLCPASSPPMETTAAHSQFNPARFHEGVERCHDVTRWGPHRECAGIENTSIGGRFERKYVDRLASYAGPVSRLWMGHHQMITGTEHQKRLALMRFQGDRESVQVVDLANLLISEHVDQHAAWHQVLGDDASGDGVSREVQHRDLLSISQLVHHDQLRLAGYLWHIELNAGGDSIALANSQNLSEPTGKRCAVL